MLKKKKKRTKGVTLKRFRKISFLLLLLQYKLGEELVKE